MIDSSINIDIIGGIRVRRSLVIAGTLRLIRRWVIFFNKKHFKELLRNYKTTAGHRPLRNITATGSKDRRFVTRERRFMTRHRLLFFI